MEEGQVTLAKKIHIYSNGDRFFTGRRFVINPRRTRNFDSLLTQVTLSLKPAFGAVRVLRTPENGHAVGDLGDLETGRSYVACAQKFVKLGYEDITTKRKPAPSPERRSKVVASGRIRKIDRTPISLYVYTNGEVLEPARRILLKPWVQKTWETVLVAINDKINLRTGAIRHIIDMASKDEVTEGVHLKNNEFYIAVGSERFKDMEYGIQTASLSPKQQQKMKYPSLRPLKKKNADDSQGSSPLESSTNSNQSNNDDPRRRKKKATTQQASNEEGIPIKPIKHVKRGGPGKTSEEPPVEEPKKKATEKKKPPQQQPEPEPKKQPAAKTQQQQPAAKPNQPPPQNKKNSKQNIDLDKDDGGVFKSKAKKQKATEVSESKDIKEEVPIDKRKAEEIEDEEVESKPMKKEPLPPISKNNHQKNTKSSPKAIPPKRYTKQDPKQKNANKDSQAQAATVIQAGYRGYKTRKELRTTAASEEDKAAIAIQAGYKGYKTRKDLQKKNQTKEKNSAAPNNSSRTENEKTAAAVKIQSNYRGHKARKDLKKGKKPDKDQETAAIKIQSNYRGHKARKDLKKGKKPDKDQETAAIKIQSNYRGHKVRKDLKKGKKPDQEAAAIKIQSSYRGHKARKDLKNKKNVDKPVSEKEKSAAIAIQSGYRGYQARKEVKALKQQSTKSENNAEARAPSSQSISKVKQDNAAVKIQANYRGYKTRKVKQAKG